MPTDRPVPRPSHRKETRIHGHPRGRCAQAHPHRRRCRRARPAARPDAPSAPPPPITWGCCGGPTQFGDGERRWAVEDCRHLSRRLERDLLAAGERIVRVPPKLMAHVRDSRPHLRQVRPDRRAGRRPRRAARARPAHRPARRPRPGGPAAGRSPRRPGRRTHPDRSTGCAGTCTSSTRAGSRRPARWTAPAHPRRGPAGRAAPTPARASSPGSPASSIQRCADLTVEINAARHAEIADLVDAARPDPAGRPRRAAPLTAAKILGETAGVDRFTSKDAYARHNGTAPLPVWSSNRAGTGSPAPATGSSTPPCTASR